MKEPSTAPLLTLRCQRKAELIPIGKLTPLRHPYLFGGGISGVLIAGAVFAFVSTVAVVSQRNLPGTTSSVPGPPHGDLTIDAGQGNVAGRAGATSPTGLLATLALAQAPSAVPRPSTPASGRTAAGRTGASPRASVASRRSTGGKKAGAGAGSLHAGATPANPVQTGPRPAPGGGPPGSRPAPAAHPAGPPGLAHRSGGHPPGLAKKPGGLPPGLAKKPGGLPPGLAKKPGGLPPGLAKKPGGLPPGLAKKPGGHPQWPRPPA